MENLRKIVVCCIVAALVFSGAVLDGVDAFLKWSDAFGELSLVTWQEWYAINAEAQLIGLSMVAFLACPYSRVKLKAASFFMVLWRIFVAVINCLDLPIIYSPAFLGSAWCLYLAWLSKSALMGTLEQKDEVPGAYYFMMPIHSVWGLIKSVFIPWRMARYESIVAVEGGTMWAVSDGVFVIKRVEETNISKREGVKVYLGRNFTSHERLALNHMVGDKAISGIRDCRRLKVA